jgi:hypothetical protein
MAGGRLRRVRARGLPFILGLILLGETTPYARRMVNSCPDRTPGANLINVITPTLKYTITNFDPSWFDTQNPEKAPLLFILTIGQGHANDGTLDSLDGHLRLRMRVDVDTSSSKNGSGTISAMNLLSQPLTKDFFGVPHRSNEIFALTWEPGGTTFLHSPFYDLVTEQHQVPEMNIIFSFALTCENDISLAGKQATIRVDSGLGGDIGKLRFVKTIQALYPGTNIASARPVPIYTINPIFKVASELFSKNVFDYPPLEPKAEIFLYELTEGQTPDDAMQGLEFAKIPLINESPIAYPSGLPRLEPGKSYVWRARAILRGPTTEYMYSNSLYFKIDERLDGSSSSEVPSSVSDLTTLEQQIKFGDDYAKRLMAALKIILGDNFEIFDLSRGAKVPAKGQIRLNGHPYSLEELERLAREFSASRHSVTRLRFQ